MSIPKYNTLVFSYGEWNTKSVSTIYQNFKHLLQDMCRAPKCHHELIRTSLRHELGKVFMNTVYFGQVFQYGIYEVFCKYSSTNANSSVTIHLYPCANTDYVYLRPGFQQAKILCNKSCCVINHSEWQTRLFYMTNQAVCYTTLCDELYCQINYVGYCICVCDKSDDAVFSELLD